jgi:hydrogenase/urease accessory protein HupE
MAEVVYALCALTSAACAVLLVRSYRRDRVRLLMWSAICFVGLVVNNLILFVDLVVVPDIDLQMVRSLAGLTGLLALLFGLVWDSR